VSAPQAKSGLAGIFPKPPSGKILFPLVSTLPKSLNRYSVLKLTFDPIGSSTPPPSAQPYFVSDAEAVS
jgi:hypothetical protein